MYILFIHLLTSLFNTGQHRRRKEIKHEYGFNFIGESSEGTIKEHQL